MAKWGKRGEPIAIRLPAKVLSRVDELVQAGKFRSRTHAIEDAVFQLHATDSAPMRPHHFSGILHSTYIARA
ncbi:MAG: ribbon-helix-helix domain-containing protein [Acidilobaceae archaeon]|nr:ribbon-helix-helix domain-containing protein [Acidilobaceae archaeon]MDW7974509.1 ribbon-helix-helix domain-containing protein [Sulfolobales archaeon]